MVLRVAIVGAESTGKSTLSRALLNTLALRGFRVSGVAEVLREWCELHQRTPRQHEQLAIAQEQSRRMAGCELADICISDTTPLMTAIYSEMLFEDPSLTAWAVTEHARFDITLLTGLDIPWVADGIQRDGPHVREPVDRALRRTLQTHSLPFEEIHGLGEQRTDAALQRVLQALLVRGAAASA